LKEVQRCALSPSTCLGNTMTGEDFLRASRHVLPRQNKAAWVNCSRY